MSDADAEAALAAAAATEKRRKKAERRRKKVLARSTQSLHRLVSGELTKEEVQGKGAVTEPTQPAESVDVKEAEAATGLRKRPTHAPEEAGEKDGKNGKAETKNVKSAAALVKAAIGAEQKKGEEPTGMAAQLQHYKRKAVLKRRARALQLWASVVVGLLMGATPYFRGSAGALGDAFTLWSGCDGLLVWASMELATMTALFWLLHSGDANQSGDEENEEDPGNGQGDSSFPIEKLLKQIPMLNTGLRVSSALLPVYQRTHAVVEDLSLVLVLGALSRVACDYSLL
jgi:hypothetical protein